MSRAPLTEEEIRAVTIGEPTVVAGPIRLVEYDPYWPQAFSREAERVRGILGGRALRIEHVGSTSVPGLAAKPIIDMVLEVKDSADEHAYVPQMVAGGYVLRIREPEWHQHRVFNGPRTDINLHVFSEECPEIERMVGFRDHLRENEADRLRYERAKRELARRTWTFVQNYADAKSDVIQEILTRSRPQPDG
jgi:GrpB-like predicted nucleotidyltransferase (UPF0157 family)